MPINRDQRILLDPSKTYLLVGHKGPDTDTIGAMIMFAEALGKPLSEFMMAFVSPGDRYTDPVPPGVDQVVHFDTGGKFDPKNYFFNEHDPNCDYPSSTRIVFEYCYDHGQVIPQYILDFVDYVDYVDSPNTRQRSQDQDDTIESLRELAQEEPGGNDLIIASKRRGPLFLAQLVNNVNPNYLSDREKVIHFWIDVDAWFNSFRNRDKVNDFLNRYMIPRTINGLTFGLIGVNSFNTKELRNCVNKVWRDRIKLYITQHKNPETGEYGSFNVTLVGDVSAVTPLQVLADRLFDRFPALSRDDEDIFIHEKGKFCMYVEPKKGLTLPRLNAMAMETLKRLAPDTSRKQFYTHNNKAPYDEVERLIREQAITRKTPSGITIGYIPPNEFTTKIIRDTVTVRFPDKYTAVVSQNPAKEWPEGQINITVIGNPRDVTGMAILARKIFDEYSKDGIKREDIFLHNAEFCLYVRAMPNLSLDRIVDLTAETLQLAAEKRRAKSKEDNELAAAS